MKFSADLKTLYEMVRDRPAPGFTKQRATAMVTMVVGVVTTMGVLPMVDGNRVLSMANIVISALFIVWGAAHTLIALIAAKDTTPTEDPRDNQGRSLVPAAVAAIDHSLPVDPDPVPLPTGEVNVGGLD